MQISLKVVRVLLQIIIIMGVTYVGNILQSVLHIPIAGSIVGLILFFLLLQFKIIPSKWVSEGSNFFLTFMVFFFVPSVVGVMDVVSEINLNFILFFVMIALGTCCVALVSGFIAEKMVKGPRYGNGQN
ncbi:CidA/LrgA family protein [Staphylococcus succinus]|uniref:CidA/LrgA family protein n=1 Tax=Staphylococcus succinus TaxID=61015 RepID=A0A9Q6HRC2_9STAP|nr:CidA/LrgA family protein [Staphylococcus succinus]PKI21555.1 CidA/LrgA family protein [Staphylococcus succinus]PTI42651.1 CidA/LrgA family protein [Staphylococcus succinus]PTI48041.1 CidA/LrgA family protein [Staphylococcus succinus]PTI66333.1 CidA/LrgA family protein [Staphylococcus succinus]PTI77511.1 CidA/LrgA family protein [Staphylococcus succinus]